MKQSREILSELSAVSGRIKVYEDIASEECPAHKKLMECKAQGVIYADLPETEKSAVKAAKAEHDKKVLRASENAQFARIEAKILRDNARRAVVAEVLPAAVSVWNKYAGKKYGPKTSDKIREEMQAETGHRISVHSSAYGNNHEMTIYHDSFRYDDLCIRSSWDNGEMLSPFLSADNKILPVEIGKLYLCDCKEYCDDYVSQAEKIVSAFHAMQEEKRKFEKSCNEFNALIPSGMKNAYLRDYSDYLNSYIK